MATFHPNRLSPYLGYRYHYDEDTWDPEVTKKDHYAVDSMGVAHYFHFSPYSHPEQHEFDSAVRNIVIPKRFGSR